MIRINLLSSSLMTPTERRSATQQRYYRRNRDALKGAAQARKLRAPDRAKQISRDSSARRWARLSDEERSAIARRSRNPEYQREYLRKYRKAGRHLRRLYGISVETYDRLLADQGGCCAVCRSTDAGNGDGSRFRVDHDHETDEIRGLLCRKCNTGIGMLGDTIEGVERALSYLRGAGERGRLD